MRKRKFNSLGNKKGIKIFLIILFVLIIILFLLWQGFLNEDKKDLIEKTPLKTNVDMVENLEEKQVFVITKDLVSGNDLTSDIYREINISTDEVPVDSIENITELDNKVLKNDLQQGDIIKRSDVMIKPLYSENDRFVEHNFTEGAIPTTIPQEQIIGSIIDVNLFVNGGEDKIVISKKTIIAKDGNKLAFYLNPQEKEFLKEAATESSLYITMYPDKNQESSEVTYIPQYLLIPES